MILWNNKIETECRLNAKADNTRLSLVSYEFFRLKQLAEEDPVNIDQNIEKMGNYLDVAEKSLRFILSVTRNSCFKMIYCTSSSDGAVHLADYSTSPISVGMPYRLTRPNEVFDSLTLLKAPQVDEPLVEVNYLGDFLGAEFLTLESVATDLHDNPGSGFKVIDTSLEAQ